MTSEPAILFGDGVHDDTAGLQAHIDGKPVVDQRTGRSVTQIPPGEYRITATLQLPTAAGTRL